MRYLFLFCFWLAAAAGMAQSVRIEGVESAYTENFEGTPLYALRKSQKEALPAASAVFTPGGDGWKFSWTYNGVQHLPDSYTDSTRLTVDLSGDGLYTMRAEKEGVDPIEETFKVFYDFMDFKIELDDVLNCEGIKIRITYLAIPEFQGNPGKENVDCWVIWDGNERQLVSLNDYVYRELLQPVAGYSTDVSCSVKIKDRFGLTWESNEVVYHSVIPEAKIDLEFGNTVSVEGEVHGEMGQAPLEVEFDAAGSRIAMDYEWYLYRDTTDLEEMISTPLDSLIDGRVRTEEDFVYTYEHPGQYKVMLVAINGEGNRCRDTAELDYVNVLASLVNVPNVFTPNGDGKNAVFRAQALSVESFHGVIMNRWGRKLYEWSDPDGGWDGRIGGKYASPGTYYYIVTARGREKNNAPRYVKKGALLLVR